MNAYGEGKYHENSWIVARFANCLIQFCFIEIKNYILKCLINNKFNHYE